MSEEKNQQGDGDAALIDELLGMMGGGAAQAPTTPPPIDAYRIKRGIALEALEAMARNAIERTDTAVTTNVQMTDTAVQEVKEQKEEKDLCTSVGSVPDFNVRLGLMSSEALPAKYLPLCPFCSSEPMHFSNTEVYCGGWRIPPERKHGTVKESHPDVCPIAKIPFDRAQWFAMHYRITGLINDARHCYLVGQVIAVNEAYDYAIGQIEKLPLNPLDLKQIKQIVSHAVGSLRYIPSTFDFSRGKSIEDSDEVTKRMSSWAQKQWERASRFRRETEKRVETEPNELYSEIEELYTDYVGGTACGLIEKGEKVVDRRMAGFPLLHFAEWLYNVEEEVREFNGLKKSEEEDD